MKKTYFILIALFAAFSAQASETNAQRCQELRNRVKQIENDQRKPQSGSWMDKLTKDKREAQDEMRKLNCSSM